MAINWSGINSQSTYGRVLRMPLRLLPGGKIMSIRRGPAAGLKWIAGSADHGCWLGTYELAKQRALERFVRPGMTIYDIGAQAGFYTLFFSRLIGPGATVYACEPCAYEARYLLDHIRMNDVQNVHVIQAAVWSGSGLSALSVDRGPTQNALSANGNSILRVPTLALDGLEFPPPDLIKMDVEGAESAVLEGAGQMLHDRRPIVFVALHGNDQREICFEFLNASKYALFELDGTKITRLIQSDEIYALPLELNQA
jgi:FkbM family methyltransferase